MVFVIVYALFIFVDLAVATASNVRPSQHQCLVGGECVRLDGPQPSPSALSRPPRPLLADGGALAPAPPVPCLLCQPLRCVLALWPHRSLLCARTPAHRC